MLFKQFETCIIENVEILVQNIKNKLNTSHLLITGETSNDCIENFIINEIFEEWKCQFVGRKKSKKSKKRVKFNLDANEIKEFNENDFITDSQPSTQFLLNYEPEEESDEI